MRSARHSPSAVINKSQRRAIKRYSAFFLLPTVIAFIIGFVWPFVWGVYLSFFRFRTLGKTTYVGFDNYLQVLFQQLQAHLQLLYRQLQDLELYTYLQIPFLLLL